MTLIYRLLGIVARFSERCSHFRINFVPFNLIFTVALGMICLVGFGGARDAIVNGDKPAVRTVADVLAHKDVDRNYVTVKGELHPELGYQQTYKGKYDTTEHPESAYVTLLDTKGERAVLVKRDTNDFDSATPSQTQITGMLVPMDTTLKSKLIDEGARIDKIYVDTEYMIEEGGRPGNASTWIPVTLISGMLLAAFLLTFAMKYVVFQKTGAGAPPMTATPSTATPGQGIDLRVTGRFTLDAHNAKRFLNVPAGIAALDTGQLALVSNIDASSRFMGITTQKRVGLWAIVLDPNGLQRLELGNLYVGFAVRPAVRVSYREGNGEPASAILSFANAAERDDVLNDLNRFSSYSMSRS